MTNEAITRVIFPDDLVQIGRQLVEDKTRAEFALGELCILVCDEFPYTKTEALTELAKQIGEEFTNLWVYEWVARAIPFSIRQAYSQLQYSHWRALAGKLELLPDALRWIKSQADENKNVSVASLKVFLHGQLPTQAGYDPGAHLQHTRQVIDQYADKSGDARARFVSWFMNGAKAVHCPACAEEVPLDKFLSSQRYA